MSPQSPHPPMAEPGAVAITAGGQGLRVVSTGPFRISVATFAPEFAIPSHFHEWACVSTLLEGRFEQRFPGRVADCPPGAVLGKPPGERHVDRWFAAPSRHLMIEINPARHGELGAARPVAEEIFHVDRIGAEALAWAALRELREADELTPLSLDGIARLLLARLHRGAGSGARALSVPGWLGRVTELLHDRYAENLRVSELAAVVGVHPDHLSRVFVRAHGTSIGAYVRRLRVDAAAALLAGSAASISSVALRTGFSDQSHLTRVFKRQRGVTPARYRYSTRGGGRSEGDQGMGGEG